MPKMMIKAVPHTERMEVGVGGEQSVVSECSGWLRWRIARAERTRRLGAQIGRRDFILLAGIAFASVAAGRATLKGQEENKMYGLISKITAVPGQRDALVAVLLEGVPDMPGCLSYVVAKDPTNAEAVWITEVWDSQESHKASLSLPSVKQAMARGKPLIAEFSQRVVTEPVGGYGLRSRDRR